MGRDARATRQVPVIAFTGGGSAGHITPNLALIEHAREAGFEAIYFGTRGGMEADLVPEAGVPFFAIPSERLRRYFDWRNFSMPLIVIVGILVATWRIARLRPALLFSKGGFAALPVVIGAWLNRVPVFIHESDRSLGLANRLSLPFTTKLCVADKRALRGQKKGIFVGTPLRRAFSQPDPSWAYETFSLDRDRPILLVLGGSQGARSINEAVARGLDQLLSRYQVVHLCGTGKRVIENDGREGYRQIEYLSEGFPSLCAAAHLVVSRAGANSIAELQLLKKPALLIPLSAQSSRGDQALNAARFVEAGFGLSLKDEALDGARLVESLEALEESYASHLTALEAAPNGDGSGTILDLIKRALR
ncbi:MAG: undecaprenyldiphospho-muramoylpentapeptide beta-N-acetylglucosaminyltransferase [Myxococcota bacterium]|nr:undecaprenyldiphospho-muramoylpentapeptide beta-N-acetylglucosaminyltransferase [Myxococcota bacterium]